MKENLQWPYALVGAAEGYLIENQQHNAFWAQCTSPKDYEWLKKEEVICSGTFAGKAHMMLAVFEHMFKLHESIADPRAFDQGLWNLTARTAPFRFSFRIPKMSEGFCATGWPSKNLVGGMRYQTDDPPVYMDDYVVYTPDGVTPFSIVHQYDRQPNWAGPISKMIADLDEKPPAGKPIILIASCQAYCTNGFNDAARDTWLKKWRGLVDYRFVLGRECKDFQCRLTRSLSMPRMPTNPFHSRFANREDGRRATVTAKLSLWNGYIRTRRAATRQWLREV